MINEKICQSCGRPFENRKKWRDIFDEIKYCSKKCKSNKSPIKLKEKIMSYLNSQNSRSAYSLDKILSAEEFNNKAILEKARCAARLLADEKIINIIQNGKTVDPTDFKGSIEIKLK